MGSCACMWMRSMGQVESCVHASSNCSCVSACPWTCCPEMSRDDTPPRCTCAAPFSMLPSHYTCTPSSASSGPHAPKHCAPSPLHATMSNSHPTAHPSGRTCYTQGPGGGPGTVMLGGGVRVSPAGVCLPTGASQVGGGGRGMAAWAWLLSVLQWVPPGTTTLHALLY